MFGENSLIQKFQFHYNKWKSAKNIRKQTLKIVFLEMKNLDIALYSSRGTIVWIVSRLPPDQINSDSLAAQISIALPASMPI